MQVAGDGWQKFVGVEASIADAAGESSASDEPQADGRWCRCEGRKINNREYLICRHFEPAQGDATEARCCGGPGAVKASGRLSCCLHEQSFL